MKSKRPQRLRTKETDAESMQSLRTKIRTARKAKGWLQKDLGKAIGRGGRQVSEWERGICCPTAATLALLSKALEQPTDWLLGLHDEPGKCLPEPIFVEKPEHISDSELMELFRNRFASARAAARHTIYSLSVEAGVNLSTVSSYSNAKYIPKINTLRRLCIALNVSADYLLGLDE